MDAAGDQTFDHGAPAGLFDAATAAAHAHAGDWFPDLDVSRLETDVALLSARPRCILHRMTLRDGGDPRQVVIKVRHSDPALRRLDRFEDERPHLSPQRLMSDEDTAAREFHGLTSLASAADSGDPTRVGVLRPLAHLPGHAALILDLADDPTLRSRLLRTSRLRPRRRKPAMPDTAWSNAGMGLRAFHDHTSTDDLPTRIAAWKDVRELIDAYTGFLSSRAPGRGTSALLEDFRRVSDHLAASDLLDRLPLAAGHGDFVANNMFASSTGRITIFDPLIEWAVPRYLDLAILTMSLRLLPIQTASQGLALSTIDLDRYEAAALRGYFGKEVPYPAVRTFQLLVLLDRWSRLVSKTPATGVVQPQVRAARVRLATRHVRREGRRLLSRLDV
ncbi:MAG: hypothetical protein ACRDO2_11135 [Nocardioidaceae bacterium]